MIKTEGQWSVTKNLCMLYCWSTGNLKMGN